MKTTEAEQELRDTCKSWREVLEAVQSQMNWLEHCRDSEVRESEAQRIRLHAERLYVALRLPVMRILAWLSSCRRVTARCCCGSTASSKTLSKSWS